METFIESQIVHAKFQNHGHIWFLTRRFSKVLVVCGHGNNIDHVTNTMFINVHPLLKEALHTI